MSSRLWGLMGVGAGVVGLIVGGWIAFVGTFSVGLGLTLIGAFAGGAGLCVLTEPWHDSVDAEIDQWERDWSARWLPPCPVHREQLCYTRTDRCPGARQRVP